MSASQLRLATPPVQSFDELTILTVPEFMARLKVSQSAAYRIAHELPPGCVIHVRHGVRIIWERALVALTEERSWINGPLPVDPRSALDCAEGQVREVTTSGFLAQHPEDLERAELEESIVRDHERGRP